LKQEDEEEKKNAEEQKINDNPKAYSECMMESGMHVSYKYPEEARTRRSRPFFLFLRNKICRKKAQKAIAPFYPPDQISGDAWFRARYAIPARPPLKAAGRDAVPGLIANAPSIPSRNTYRNRKSAWAGRNPIGVDMRKLSRPPLRG
jgi:hypothetical protein